MRSGYLGSYLNFSTRWCHRGQTPQLLLHLFAIIDFVSTFLIVLLKALNEIVLYKVFSIVTGT